MDECSVCCENFTSSVRKKISCPKCNNDTCVKCVQRYLLGSLSDPHCLHCKHGFSRMFLQTNLNKSFIDKDYARHRSEILWNREESFLPEAQIKAERILRGRKLRSENNKHPELRAKIKIIEDKVIKLLNEKRALWEIIYSYERDIDRLLEGLPTKKEAEELGKIEEPEKESVKKKFTRKCMKDGCNGWLNTSWKCGLCDCHFCSECFGTKQKDKEHVCNPDDVASANILKKDTKPCPKCGNGIQRVSGCPSMFCVSCHTPFDWNTGEIITARNIHNPHYFEWRNQIENGNYNENVEQNCDVGGVPTDDFIWRCQRSPIRADLENKYRLIAHIEDAEMNKYREINENTEPLRIKYLLKEVDKLEIQRLLQNRERKNERNKAIRDVLDTFVMAAAEQLRILSAEIFKINREDKCNVKLDDIRIVPTLSKFNEQLELLRVFINKTLSEVSIAYGCVVPQISELYDTPLSTQSFKSSRKNKNEDD